MVASWRRSQSGSSSDICTSLHQVTAAYLKLSFFFFHFLSTACGLHSPTFGLFLEKDDFILLDAPEYCGQFNTRFANENITPSSLALIRLNFPRSLYGTPKDSPGFYNYSLTAATLLYLTNLA